MNKSRVKSLLYNYEVRLVSVITEGVLLRHSKKSVIRSVRNEILKIKLTDDENSELWKFSLAYYRHCVAGAGRETDAEKRAVKIYSVLRRDAGILEHQKNEIADKIEYRNKIDELKKTFRSGSKFYYCTAHKDCAVGHLAYQGKVYYRRLDNYSNAEMDFIDNNELMSVEDAVMAPVYLVTRPNCRHRFVPISYERAVEMVLGHVEARKSDEKDGEGISYEESQYRSYLDRLKMMVSVKKIFKSSEIELPEQLKADIRRTRLTVLSWKSKIKAGS